MHATLDKPVAFRSAAAPNTSRYARCIEASKRIRWDIDRDVIRGRSFDFGKKFLPDGLSKIGQLAFLSPAEKRFLSQIQGRTYANMFALVERYHRRQDARDQPRAMRSATRSRSRRWCA